MKKAEWAGIFDGIVSFIEDAARTHYDGDLEKGFKFWAVSQVLMDTGLSDDAIGAPLELDGRGDLGIDGYYEDEEEEILSLIQSKFHAKAVSIGNEELNRFFSVLRKILDPDVVVASKNPLANDAHRAASDAISKGWTLRFVFVTTGYLSSEANVFLDQHQSEIERLDSVPVNKELEAYDLPRLWDLYQSHLTPSRYNTDVEMTIPAEDRHVSNVSGFRVLSGAVRGIELVKAFREHGYALFKLNPRGPLQNRINSTVKKTLEDKNRRKWFFHLNNGITALCDGFDPQDDVVRIRDFQIVNGCQTTVTLHKMAPVVEADPDVRVMLRLFEGVGGISREIADATNTQARLTAQDKKSNDPLQADLKKRFDALPEPIFYEVKRGDWEMADNKDRYIETATKTHRRVNMVDVAQATLAFLGEPGDAKDKPRSIFENDGLYKKVFPDGVRPQQLLLPLSVYREAQHQCEEWEQFPGATYARYCLVAIVGSEWAPDQELPSVKDASRFAARSDEIRDMIRAGQQAIASVVATLGEDYPGHREFFRSTDFFGKVLRTYRGTPKS